MTDRDPAPKRIEICKAARAIFWILVGAIAILALYPRLTLPEPQATQGMTQYLIHAFAFSVLMIIGSVGVVLDCVLARLWRLDRRAV